MNFLSIFLKCLIKYYSFAMQTCANNRKCMNLFKILTQHTKLKLININFIYNII